MVTKESMAKELLATMEIGQPVMQALDYLSYNLDSDLSDACEAISYIDDQLSSLEDTDSNYMKSVQLFNMRKKYLEHQRYVIADKIRILNSFVPKIAAMHEHITYEDCLAVLCS